MDKLTFAKTHYNNGYRAYYRDGGLVFTHPKHYPQYASDPEYWQSLRAYQDAERKKGEPIGNEHFGYEKSYDTQDCRFEFRRGGMAGDGRPYINVFAFRDFYAIKCHAKFTNFRWRAGYPKGGQNGRS